MSDSRLNGSFGDNRQVVGQPAVGHSGTIWVLATVQGAGKLCRKRIEGVLENKPKENSSLL